MRTRHPSLTFLVALLLAAFLTACGSSQTPSDATADAPGAVGDETTHAEDDAGEAVEVGFLNINSRPTGAILINGEETEASTPVEGLAVPVGRHTVQIRFEESATLSEEQTVMVRAGVSASLFFRDRSDAPAENGGEASEESVEGDVSSR